MNSDNLNQFVPQSQVQPISAQKHVPFEKIIAVIFLLTGYFICRFVPFSENPMGAAILLFVIAVLSAVYLIIIRKNTSVIKVVLKCCIPVILSVALIIQNDNEGFLTFCITVLYFFSLLYVFAESCGVLIEKTPGKYFFYDAVKVVLINPFGRFCNLFIALFSKRNGKKGKIGKIVAYVFLGLLIAAIPVALVTLLLSYDEGFVNLLDKIFSFEIDEILSHLFSFILGIPLAMMLFSAVFSSVVNEFPGILTKETAESISRKSKFLPLVLSCVALVPFIVVYVIFFISQKDYYFAAFGGVLPEGYSFSRYAVEGFENLCIVSAINGIVLWVFHCFTKKDKNDQNSIAERIGTVLISLATILLIVTAVAKLILYVNEYGFTLKRFYAGWFMLLLFIVFLAVILKQFINKMQLNTVIILIFAVLFGAISLYDWKGFMADYNADFYINGHMDKVDSTAFAGFGDSAVPAMVRFVNGDYDSQGYVSRKLASYFEYSASGMFDGLIPDRSFFSGNIPYYSARAALKELDISKLENGIAVYKNKHNKEFDPERKTKYLEITVVTDNDDISVLPFVNFSIFENNDVCLYENAAMSTCFPDKDDPLKAVIPVDISASSAFLRITLFVPASDNEQIIAGIEYSEISLDVSVEELEYNGKIILGYDNGEYWLGYEC